MTKPKTCTVCQLPVRGHRGPHGRGKCGVDLSSTADTDSDRRRLEDRVRRSLRKLKGDSKVKDYAKGLWSEVSASDEEHPPTVKDLREKEALTSNVDKTLEEIFGQKSPGFSRKPSRRDTTLRSSSVLVMPTENSGSRPGPVTPTDPAGRTVASLRTGRGLRTSTFLACDRTVHAKSIDAATGTGRAAPPPQVLAYSHDTPLKLGRGNTICPLQTTCRLDAATGRAGTTPARSPDDIDTGTARTTQALHPLDHHAGPAEVRRAVPRKP
ncbi:Hypp3490 [Branchiostoma lanceolatum]|uniref:Hypp3490 protein n=1 Tax=Branchiostoma lanceolatum TaxID=7740 RepID=A0A8K0A535_BRALA|nr:Hypp3490 [Branchiostoma lanceolatum]